MFESSGMMEVNFLLERSLDASTLRSKVIANNIANVDTPHFKRSEVNFESELKRAIEDREQIRRGTFEARTTNEKHIPFNEERDVRSVQSRINLDYSTSYRSDGNNVDIEKEIVDAQKSSMRYGAAVQSISQNLKMLKLVMRSV